MIQIDIPNFGIYSIRHCVFDFNGTLAVDGVLSKNVADTLQQLSNHVEIHIVTADTYGTAKDQLAGLNLKITFADNSNQAAFKAKYVKQLGEEQVIAFGNGRNDALMLKAAALGIAVCMEEGAATDAVLSADVLVQNITDGIGLILNKLRLKATLRK